MIRRVLCVCEGNRDRSPFMAAVLQMYLDAVVPGQARCESAGILEVAGRGSGASPFIIKAAKRIGIDLSGHVKRRIDSLDISGYDLFVCVDEKVASHVIGLGTSINKVCNAQVSNPWPSQFQRDYDDTAGRIMERMFHVVTRYFSAE